MTYPLLLLGGRLCKQRVSYESLTCDVLAAEAQRAYSGGGVGLIVVDIAVEIGTGGICRVLVLAVELKRATWHLYRAEKVEKVTRGVAILRIKAMKSGSYKARFARQITRKTYSTHTTAIGIYWDLLGEVIDRFAIA